MKKCCFVLTLLLMLSMVAFPAALPQEAAASGPALLHQYDFNGNFTDSRGTGVSLTEHPNTTTSGFGDGEWWWTATQRPGGGLILETALITNPQSYSLGFRVKYNQVSPSWRKILSFKGPTSDNGLYFYNSYLQFYPFGSNTAITYQPNTFYDFIFSRSSDKVIRVYVVEGDGSITMVYERDDPSDATVPIQVGGKYQFMFFMDDTATSGEYTNGGTVRSIRVWDGPIGADGVGGALSDVVTNAASDITAYTATLNGSVNPYGIETSVYFEYGLTSSYGTEVMADESPIANSTDISKPISGLTANTTYHYRVKTVNTAGTTYGADQTFTTADPPAVSVGGVTLNLKELTMLVGGSSAVLVATVDPPEADNKNVAWTSSDESVATVQTNSPATVTPVGEGTAIITVTTEDGEYSDTCVVTVLPVTEPQGWSIQKMVSQSEVSLDRGESTTIEYTINTQNDSSEDPAQVIDPNLVLNGVELPWEDAIDETITLHGFEFTRVPGFDGPLSPLTLEGGTYTYQVIITNASAEFGSTFILENNALLAIENGGLSDAVTVTITTPGAIELPATGGYAHYGLGLLAWVGGALALRKKKK